MADAGAAAAPSLRDSLIDAFIDAINANTTYDPMQTLGNMAPAPYGTPGEVAELFGDVNAKMPAAVAQRIAVGSTTTAFRTACIGKRVSDVVDALLDPANAPQLVA